MEKHVPSGISGRLNEHYDPADPDAYLDVFYPTAIDNTGRLLPTIVWVHGGGWISGKKEYVDNYARILAGQGYTVASVDYSIAPAKTYPVPIKQVNAALAYLAKNNTRLHVDPSHFFLAGDSAGAQIAADLANTVTVPSYAKAVGIVPSIQRSQLDGVILFCGVYDTGPAYLSGSFGHFVGKLFWYYSGEKNFASDPRFATASVINYVTAEFPPAFISAGNADPYGPQSKALAKTLSAHGVPVDTLFYPDNYTPPLPHEYQFDLDTDAGRLALKQSLIHWLRTHELPNHNPTQQYKFPVSR